MALFNKKQESEKAPSKKASKTVKKVAAPKKSETKAVAPKKVSTGKGEMGDYSLVLSRPRVTEKASLKAEAENVYVFEVERSANKETIYRALVDLYKVTPRKIAIAQTPSKNVFSRGRKGVQKGVKKAYVYLNKGDKIELI